MQVQLVRLGGLLLPPPPPDMRGSFASREVVSCSSFESVVNRGTNECVLIIKTSHLKEKTG